jgi:hypothetical protein
MALLLWSPVVIPFLPILVQNWSIKASSGIVGYACVFGLYASLSFLIMLWGKRIRGYDDPVVQYGLDLISATRVTFLFLSFFNFCQLTTLYIHGYDDPAYMLGLCTYVVFFLSWKRKLKQKIHYS